MDKSKQVYNRTNFIQGSAKKKTRKVKKKKKKNTQKIFYLICKNIGY